MTTSQQLHAIIQDLTYWVEEHYATKKKIPCEYAPLKEIYLSNRKTPSLPSAKLPSFQTQKAPSPKPLSPEPSQKAPTSPQQKPAETAKEPSPLPSLQQRFGELATSYQKLFPKIELSTLPPSDKQAYLALEEMQKAPQTAVYLFVQEELSSHPFYQSLCSGLCLAGIKTQLLPNSHFDALSASEAPSHLRALFLPKGRLGETLLKEYEGETQQQEIKKWGTLPVYCLYPPEYYEHHPQNKRKLWRTLQPLLNKS